MNFALLSTVIAALMLTAKTYFDAHPGATDADTRSLIYTIAAAILGALLAILSYTTDPATANLSPVPYVTLILTGIAASVPPGIGVTLLTLLGIKVSPPATVAQDVQPRRVFSLWM